MPTAERPFRPLTACTLYGVVAGTTLGVLELLINSALYLKFYDGVQDLPGVKSLLITPLCYGFVAAVACVSSGTAALWGNRLLKKKTPLGRPLLAAGALGTVIYVFTLCGWLFQYTWNKREVVSLFLEALLWAFLSGKTAHFFLKRQEHKHRFWIAYCALLTGILSFYLLFFFILTRHSLFSLQWIKYALPAMAGAMSASGVVYCSLLLLKKHTLPGKLFGAALFAACVAGISFFFFKATLPKQKNSNNVLIPTSNLQTLRKKAKPNILLITPDTLRADRLNNHKYSRALTPAIDALAARGVLFKKMLSVSPWTLPSFGSLFTSLYPSVHGAQVDKEGSVNRIRKNIVPLARLLKEIGYQTQGIVHNSYLGKMCGLQKGFDSYYNKGNKIPRPANISLLSKIREKFRKKKREKLNPSTLISTMALDWLDQYDREQPFFLWLHYIDPHLPYENGKKHHLFPRYEGVLKNIPQKSLMQFVRIGKYRISREDKEFLESLYDEEVMWLDENVALVLKKLADLGLEDNTIVILLSDHGEEFWEHDGFEHGHTLYNELLHVPCIISYPKGLPRGTVIESQVSNLDIMPTLLEMLGVEHDLELTGKSLLPLIQGNEEGNRIVFSESLLYFEERKAVNKGRYKLIYFPDSDKYELYDLFNDPAEQKNLAAAYPRIKEELFQKIKAWREGCARQNERLTPGGVTEKAYIDEAVRQELRALGYVQ